MTAFVPTQLGVMLPSDINDLTANGIADGEFAKRVGGAWDGANAVENALHNPLAEISDVSFIRLNLGSGNNTILLPTIPTGYKLWIPTITFWNTHTSSVSYIFYISRGGTDYYLVNSAIASNNPVQVSSIPLIVSPTDSLILNLATASVVSFAARAFLIPDTGAIKALFVPIDVSPKTIYTCPVGKRALFGIVDTVNGRFIISNLTTATRSVQLYAVPNGGSPAASNLIFTKSIANSGFATQSAFVPLEAGDSIQLVSDGVGNLSITTVAFEFDA